AAVADHGAIRGDTVRGNYADAAAVLAALAQAGIDYDDVVHRLEHDGLITFQASWAALTDTLQRKLAPGRRDGSRGAARRGLRRPRRPARSRATPALPAATAVEGLPAGSRRP